jgi:glyoxylase-like metal-dependent hydrolase (beta-lactamase superfamily II)
MSPDVEAFFHAATQSLTYLVSDPASGRAAVIDPVLDYDWKRARTSTQTARQVLDSAAARGLTIDWLLETHVHADHLSAADWLKAQTGAPTAIGSGVTIVQAAFVPLFAAADVAADGSDFDRLLDDGARLPLGELQIEVMAVPGHTPACVAYRIGDTLFVGDTLSMPDLGTARCDFPGGDAAALYDSLRRMLALNEATRIFVCHDYPSAERPEPVWETSVAAQRADNIHVRDGITQADYVAMRTARDTTLDAPALILPALQVNIRAGRLPPPGPDGQVRLSLPVNAI